MRRSLLIGLLMLVGVAWAWLAAPLSQSALAQKPAAPPAQKKDYELRIIRVGPTFQAVRFKVNTGESWRMAGDHYEKLPETGPVPAGDYEVTLVTDDTNWMAFRIDRLTGATWQLRNNKWLKVKEPGEKPE